MASSSEVPSGVEKEDSDLDEELRAPTVGTIVVWATCDDETSLVSVVASEAAPPPASIPKLPSSSLGPQGSTGETNWYLVSAILLSIVGSAGFVLSLRARRSVT
ncbi:MAG: hypothetical protein IH959_02355 [Chloroflexi bacterium]|nr:hypothetical protein [Chloroflexota bacterium]